MYLSARCRRGHRSTYLVATHGGGQDGHGLSDLGVEDDLRCDGGHGCAACEGLEKEMQKQRKVQSVEINVV